MSFDDSDSDDSLLNAGPRRTTRTRKKEEGKRISLADIATTLKLHDKDTKIRAEQYQLLQKENVLVSDSELQLIVDKMTSTTSKNRKKNLTLLNEIDLKDGYDGAFPRKEFAIMKEIIETESSKRQGTLQTIYFAPQDELFFDSKEKACSVLESNLESSEPSCELTSRFSALIRKNVLKNFLRADRFLTLLAASDEKTSSATKLWLFKVACSAGCGDKDLADLGNAALFAIKKIGQYPSSTFDNLESLLDCWLAKPSDSSSSVGKNIMGLRNVLVLAAKFCSFDASSKHDFDRILTQIIYIGLDVATTTGFCVPINNLFDPIIDTIAKKQEDDFDRWCTSWSDQFAKDMCSSNARNQWLALPAAVRLVNMSWSTALTTFRSYFAISVLHECLGTDAVEEWLKETDKTYLLKRFEDEMMWKSLTVSYFGLSRMLACFDELKEQQERLRSIVESIFLSYCSGISLYDRKTGHDDDSIRLLFISDFDRTTEKLQGGKTGKITSPHIMRTDYLLSIIHSNSTTLKQRLHDKRGLIGQVKQANLSSFFTSAKPASSDA